MENVIKARDHILIQRQDYMKLYKLKDSNNIVRLGQYQVELDSVIDKHYFDSFQMLPKGNKKLYTLQKIDSIPTLLSVDAEGTESGHDNRNIIDDGMSQMLSKDDIERLKDESTNGTEIMTKLISNSKTFAQKTEFSQLKYVKKKQKKYCEYISVRRPSIRLLADIYFKKNQTIRIDDLSQMLSHANVQSNGRFLLYDSGSNGLIPAAILNAIGRDNGGQLVYMHPGNESQKTCVEAMQFPQELTDRFVNVNVYSLLRWYYQKFRKDTDSAKENEEFTSKSDESEMDVEKNALINKRIKEYDEKVIKEQEKVDKQQIVDEGTQEVDEKRQKVKEKQEKVEKNHEKSMETDENHEKRMETEEEQLPPCKRRKLDDTPRTSPAPDREKKTPIWHANNEKACVMLDAGVDSLLVACKEHPQSIVSEFIPFLKASRTLVVHHALREPLLELYTFLASRPDFINVHVSNNFTRRYQVLPERTHPLVNMDAGGYLLTAHKVLCS